MKWKKGNVLEGTGGTIVLFTALNTKKEKEEFFKGVSISQHIFKMGDYKKSWRFSCFNKVADNIEDYYKAKFGPNHIDKFVEFLDNLNGYGTYKEAATAYKLHVGLQPRPEAKEELEAVSGIEGYQTNVCKLKSNKELVTDIIALNNVIHETEAIRAVDLQQLQELATSIHVLHYANTAPEWKVLGDMQSVASQISNMVSGLKVRIEEPEVQKGFECSFPCGRVGKKEIERLRAIVENQSSILDNERDYEKEIEKLKVRIATQCGVIDDKLPRQQDIDEIEKLKSHIKDKDYRIGQLSNANSDLEEKKIKLEQEIYKTKQTEDRDKSFFEETIADLKEKLFLSEKHAKYIFSKAIEGCYSQPNRLEKHYENQEIRISIHAEQIQELMDNFTHFMEWHDNPNKPLKLPNSFSK